MFSIATKHSRQAIFLIHEFGDLKLFEDSCVRVNVRKKILDKLKITKREFSEVYLAMSGDEDLVRTVVEAQFVKNTYAQELSKEEVMKYMREEFQVKAELRRKLAKFTDEECPDPCDEKE